MPSFKVCVFVNHNTCITNTGTKGRQGRVLIAARRSSWELLFVRLTLSLEKTNSAGGRLVQIIFLMESFSSSDDEDETNPENKRMENLANLLFHKMKNDGIIAKLERFVTEFWFLDQLCC